MIQKWAIRFGLLGALGTALFVSGVLWSNARHAEREAAVAQETARLITERETQLREEHAAALAVEEAARVVLSEDMEAIRTREQGLRDQIVAMELTPSIEEIVVERLVEVPGECPMIVANPLGEDFVRLWNYSSRP